jgi:hypothetical protein
MSADVDDIDDMESPLTLSQIRPIKGTHAFVIFSLQDICAGESITVRYTEDESYFANKACQCSNCTGKSCEAPRQERGQKKRKTYRRGKKERQRREHRELREQVAHTLNREAAHSCYGSDSPVESCNMGLP